MKTLVATLFLALLMQSASVSAHPMPTSRVDVRILEKQWHLELQLPTDRLVSALELAGNPGQPTGSATTSAETGHLRDEVIKEYIVDRIKAHSLTGPADPWAVKVENAEPSNKAGYWTAHVVLEPPAHADLSRVNIEYHVIGQEIITHTIDVVLVEDWASPGVREAPEHLTSLRARRSSILLERE